MDLSPFAVWRRGHRFAGRVSRGNQAARARDKVCLAAGALFHVKGERQGSRTVAACGNLWITQEGRLEDVILAPGQSFRISQRGLVLIQGLQEAEFYLVRLGKG